MKTVHDLEGKKIDQFLIRRKIYSTHFSVVYEATDMSLGHRQVAIKFANPGSNLPRFIKDAVFLGKLSANSHIVNVYNVVPKNEKQLDEADYVYFSMQFIPNTLEKKLKKEKSLSLIEGWEILKGVCDALHFAHNHPKRIIHRDIKPPNILLGSNGDAYLCDFGLARSDNSDSTKTIGLAGTPGYLSPEQAGGQELDQRTDIYSLGVVLYQMFTGKMPFQKKTRESIITDVLTKTPPRADQVNKDIPEAIADVIEKCLKKKKEERFKSVKDLLKAFMEAMIKSGNTEIEKESIRTLLPQHISQGLKKLILALLGVTSLGVISTIIFFLLLKPVEITIRTSVTENIKLTVNNTFWETDVHDAKSNTIIQISHMLIGNREFSVNAEGYLPDTFSVNVSPRKSNRFIFALQPAYYSLKIITIPTGAFCTNSFKPVKTVNDSFLVDYSGGDTVTVTLAGGLYEFQLNYDNYKASYVELDVNRDLVRWRKTEKKKSSSWNDISIDAPLKVALNPKVGYIGLKLYHRKIVNGRKRHTMIDNFDNFRVNISPDSEIPPMEAAYLQNKYFENLESYKHLIVPVTIKSITFKKKGMEKVIENISLSPEESKNIRVYFETKKEYGFVSFIANLPDGPKNINGVHVSITGADVESEGKFHNPLSGNKKTPLNSVKFETGKYQALFKALGWYYEKEFTVLSGRGNRVECKLHRVKNDVQILLGGLSCFAVFRRKDPLFQVTHPDTFSVPFPQMRSFQRGIYEITLLNEHGNAFFTEDVSILQDTTITLSVDSN